MKRKILALALALTLCLGLVPAGLAYDTPDFSDVPSTHWAYGAVMRMADKGVLNGVGEGKFNPDGKVTAEQFITLVGRAVFPDIKVEGKDWSGPYISEAKAKGMLEGTNVTDEAIKNAISRYDMAVILAKAVEILKVSATKADSSKVNDYGEVPTKYVDAVLTAYGSGLITGDDNHNFNGGNTMRRSEAATVMDRVVSLKASGSTNPGGTTTEPTKDDEKKQTTEEYLASNQDNLVTYTVDGYFQKTDHDIGRPAYDKHFYDFPDMPYKVYYTRDGGKTSALVAEGVTGNSDSNVHGKRSGEFTFEIQLPKDAFLGYYFGMEGLYFSAETELDGQKLVTSDLRTDGRAYVTVKNPNVRLSVDLTPPTGEKAKFTIKGAITYGLGGASRVGEGFTVQLHLKDGRVLAETTTEANGRYTLNCEVDAIDNGFDVNIEQYYVTASGILNGVPMKSKETRLNGELALYSLDFMGGNPYSSRNVSWYVDVFSVE